MTGKKSFILYADLIHTLSKLPDDKAGQLFKLILDYVNDKDPESEDLLLQIAFEPIKQQLKRDLVSWREYREKQSENGKLGGRPKKTQTQENPKNPSLILESEKSLNVTANVNATVTENVIDTNTTSTISDKSHKKSYDERKGDFKKTLFPHTNKYGVEMCKAFFEYWAEPDKKERMRFEQEKFWDLPRRLATWKLNEDKKTNQNVRTGTIRQRNSTENIKSAALAILNRDNS